MIAKLLNSLEPFSTPINFELPLHKNCIKKEFEKLIIHYFVCMKVIIMHPDHSQT